MEIMDMSLRQILQAAQMHPVQDIVDLVFVDNVLAGACAAAGWTKGETFFLKSAKFLGAILAAIGKKVSPAAAKSTSAILIIAACALSGCASYNQKAVCLQLGTTNASIPYVGGATSGSGFACYYSYLGFKNDTPDPQTMTKLMTAEATATNNSIITSGPVKITATPLK